MEIKDKKVLVITGCSKKKLEHKAAAKDLNQGTFFKKSKKLAKVNNFDLKILSGKYGLLDPNKIIEPYDQKIRTKADIERIRKQVSPRIDKLKGEYDIIILIMGKTYRRVMKYFIDNTFRIIYNEKGIFGYIKQLNNYIKLPTKKLLKELEQFKPYLESHISKLNKPKLSITDFLE